MRIVYIFSVCLLMVFIYACSPRIAPVPSQQEKVLTVATAAAHMQTEEEAEGQSLFENNCTNCHGLYKPTDFTKEQWKPIIEIMHKNAGLTRLQGDKIYAYVASRSKQ